MKAKKLFYETCVFFLMAIFGIVLSYVPGQDIWGPCLVPVFYIALRIIALRKIGQEEQINRHIRLCQEKFPVQLRENPSHLSNILLAEDMPWAWVEWIENDLKFNFMATCGRWLHLIDSFCKVGDLPGQAIARATGIIYEYLRYSPISMEGGLEDYLEGWAEDHMYALGKAFQKDCYYKELQYGDIYPYGLFQCTRAIVLGTTYSCQTTVKSINWFGVETTTIKTVQAARLCVKDRALKSTILEAFPEFRVENFGSGPQNLGVFIQENINVDPDDFYVRLLKFSAKLK